MTLRISVDSIGDTPTKIVEKYGIEHIPININYGTKTFKANVDITADEVLKGLLAGEVYKTSLTNPEEFKSYFEPYAQDGIDCIHVSFSSKLSGLYQSALIAKKELIEKYPNFKMAVIDSWSSGFNLSSIAIRAKTLYEKGKTMEEIEEILNHIGTTDYEILMGIDDLTHLYRTGRINKTSKVIGGLLNVKPILTFKDGDIEECAKERGTKRLVKKMAELIEEKSDLETTETVAVGHAGNKELAEKVAEAIKDKFVNTEVIVRAFDSPVHIIVLGPKSIVFFGPKKK